MSERDGNARISCLSPARDEPRGEASRRNVGVDVSLGRPGDFCVNAAPVELVLNGYPLSLRHKGTGAYTARLIHGLRRRAPERKFRVVVPAFLREEVAAEFPAELFDFVAGDVPVKRAIARDIYWSSAIVRHICHCYPNAVFHSPGEIWAWQRPRRTMVTLYDCIYREFPRLQGGFIRTWWWRATERYARHADRVLTISEHSRRELIEKAGIPMARIRVVYPWVDTFAAEGNPTPAAAAAVARRYDLPDDYLLYVGGYNCNKNVDRLIEAYARANRDTRLPPLALAGNIPPADARLAVCDVRGAMAAAGLGTDRVRLIGPVAVADLAAVVRGAKVLAYPSLHEGFGYPPAEAMAVGTPVICADGTSLVEVVRNPSARFDPRDVAQIAARIREAVAAPDRFRSALPQEFTEAIGVGKYLAVVDELAGLYGGPAPSAETRPSRS